jgi:hypothetical protein
VEWLKDHDECPCCRSNYLAFSDDGGDGDNHTGDAERGFSSTLPESHPIEEHPQLDEDYLARLYQTGPYETSESAGQNGVHNRDEERWEVQFERTLERLRGQVDERVQIARRQVRDHRENRRQESDGGGDDDNDDMALEDRVERSVQRVRSQLSRLRQAADRELRNRSTRNNNGDSATRNQHGEARWEDAIQVVRTRLSDIANSESAGRLREKSVRTMQNLMRQASQRRSGT